MNNRSNNDQPPYVIDEGDAVVPPDTIVGPWVRERPFDHPSSDVVLDDSVELVDRSSQRKTHQKQLHDTVGFFATSPEELVKAGQLVGAEDTLGTVLGSIGVSQSNETKLTKKQKNAVAAEVKELKQFARRARGDMAALAFLGGLFVDSTELLPTTSIKNVNGIEGWNNDDLLRRAFADLLRFAETVEFVEGQGSDHLADNYSKTDPDMLAKLERFVRSLGVTETKDLIAMSVDQHEAQMEFWVSKLQDIERHKDLSIQTMVAESLRQLGISRPE